MAIPEISNQNIIDALKFIDENGVPQKNESTKYALVTDEGKSYPPKYVIGVANYVANGGDINTDDYNAVEAKNFLKTRGFVVEEKQEKYELTITANDVISSDPLFDINRLELGDNYKPIEAFFRGATGDIIRRNYKKGEVRISNQTLPRLTCQIFEKQISSMSDYDKQNFPICRYNPDSDMIRGIFSTVEEYRKKRNTKSIQYLIYARENGPQFVIYSWNLFSTIIFVQECLKRFGEEGDSLVLLYRDKTDYEKNQAKSEEKAKDDVVKTAEGCKNPYSKILLKSKNIIFRGAPGTGKSYLAKSVAADIISDGLYENYSDLSKEQKEQIEFVQFHPSYDYSDFVEGLRPVMNADGSMGFELQDGVFKRFVTKAKNNYEASLKDVDEGVENLKKYIFIIDEINRGEISKILGELFFSIDPGYRGVEGAVSTQYANMHADPDEKFYIPENVYIIGTMNDIDRSVDSFDFAMRRRFRFIEVTADESSAMLEGALLDEEIRAEACKRMSALNKEIKEVPDLNENYQIGAAYFLKLKDMSFDELWTDCLQPVLQDYVRGMYDEDEIMKKFARAYKYVAPDEETVNED